MTLARRHPQLRRYDRFVERHPSFAVGFESVFDLGRVFASYRYDPPPDVDASVLASDWEAIGNDMWAAISRFEDEAGVHLMDQDEAKEAVQLRLW